MNQNVALVSAAVELLLSFGLALLVGYGGFRTFSRMTRDLDEVAEIRRNNIAVAIVLVAMVVAAALVVRAAVYPAIGSLQTALFGGIDAAEAIATILRIVAFVVIAVFVSILAIAAGTRIFLRLTHDIDELAELRANNVAVAIMLAGFIFIMGLFLAGGVGSLLTALIPDPVAARIEVLGTSR